MVFTLKLHSWFLFMAYYHVHGLIPDGISQSEGYRMFEQYIASGAPMDNFDGFELVSRFHAPETGEVFVTFKADNHLAISQHFGVWRAKFSLNWYHCCFKWWWGYSKKKKVADAVAAMG